MAITKEMIPSESIRKYLKSIKHSFSDSEKATLIYNSDMIYSRRIAEIQKLAEKTDDQQLKIGVEVSVKFDNFLMDVFKKYDKNYYYEVSDYDDFSDKRWVFGNYDTFEDAYAFGCTLFENYRIQKCRYNEAHEAESVSSAIYRRSFPNINQKSEFIKFESFRKMYDLEATHPEVDEKELYSTRFEYQYVCVPVPFDTGDIVYDMHGDRFCVIAESTQDYQDRQEIFKEKSTDLTSIYDLYIHILSLNYKGVLQYESVSPLYLTNTTKFQGEANKTLFQFLDSVSHVIRGNVSYIAKASECQYNYSIIIND